MKALPFKHAWATPTEAATDFAGRLVVAGDELAYRCHAVAYLSGWWHDPATGELKDRNVGELLMLCVSELSEAMEGHRKGLPDDHLPHRLMFHVELADALIRIFDLCGAAGIPIGAIIAEKLAYNATRADHRPEARTAAHGKSY